MSTAEADLPAAIDKLGDAALKLIAHLQDQRDELAEVLHDILEIEQELDHAPYSLIPAIKERKAKAWARAWEFFQP